LASNGLGDASGDNASLMSHALLEVAHTQVDIISRLTR